MSNSILFEGWFFEDYEIGQEIITSSRTITEADIVNFAGITGDWNPLHTDSVFAGKSFFGKRVAHGALTFVIMTGLLARTGIIEKTVYAFYGVDRLRLLKPVYIRDTIKVIAKIVEKEDKGYAGKIVIEAKVVNQNDVVVLTSLLGLLVKKRSQG